NFTERYRLAEDALSKLVKRPTDYGIGAYLTDPFLDLLLPRSITEQFYRVLSSYYTRYFGLDVHWNSTPPLLSAIEFAKSTRLVIDVLKATRELLDIGY